MAGLIASALAGGMTGAGNAAQDAFKRQADQQNRIDFAQIASDIDKSKQLAIMEVQQRYVDKNRSADQQVRRDDALWTATNPELRQGLIDTEKGKAQAKLDVEYDEGNVSRRIDADTRASRAANEESNRSQVELLNNPDYITGNRRLAQARHVESSGSAAQGELARMAIEDKKRIRALTEEYATASPERKQQITDQIQLITGKDNDNYLPIPIKDERGEVTGYRVFDKKRGTFADQGGAGRSDDPLGLRNSPQSGASKEAPSVSGPKANRPSQQEQVSAEQQRMLNASRNLLR